MFQFCTGITNGKKGSQTQAGRGLNDQHLCNRAPTLLCPLVSQVGTPWWSGLVWCEMWIRTEKKKRESVCIAMSVCVRGILWASQTFWSQDQQNNTDLIMPVHFSGKKNVVVSCYRVKDLLVWLQRCKVGLHTGVRDEGVCFCAL